MDDLPPPPSLAASPPTTPSTPSFPPADKPKKPNPLNDLIDTERAYVDLLAGIIRKVAAAWSRSNLPPPDLDVMFRSIEAVYKANRALHNKLKDIGTNPSSPKALGDLLMRWIDDLNAPYTNYCTRYRCGFDNWYPVQSNTKLPDILAAFSVSNPPSASSGSSAWTLDDLFLLPKARLKYYKKLYNRLLKSTAPGRSDHRLLVGALETLDQLLTTLEAQSSVNVADTSPSPPPPVTKEVEHAILQTQEFVQEHYNQARADIAPQSRGSSPRASSASGEERLSRETANTSVSRASTDTLSMPISHLERRLSTQRTIDIFTMQPKVVRLQMTPPSLTFTRELRFSGDVVVGFTSQATGSEVVHPLGHIFLLSDLFLVCERITPEDRSQVEVEDADMWLCYPPLSGKVLRVSEIPEQPNAIKVAIMRKEHLIIETKSPQAQSVLMSHFKQCIEFAAALPPPSKQPPPPVPPLPQFSRFGPAAPGVNGPLVPAPQLLQRKSMSPPNTRSSSPARTGPSFGLHTPPVHQGGDMDGRGVEIVSRPSSGAERLEQPRAPDMSAPPRTTSAPQYYPQGLPGQSVPPHPGQLVRPSLPAHPAPPGHPRGGPGLQGPPQPFQQPGIPTFQPFPQRPGPQGPHGFLPPGAQPPRPPSEPGRLRHSVSNRSLGSQYNVQGQGLQPGQAPPVPPFPGGYPPPPPGQHFLPRSNSWSNLHAPQPRPLLPSLQVSSRAVSVAEPSFDDPSPPNSPVEETPRFTQPTTSTVSASMKCKVFLQQQHAQWKALGSAKLKLYRQDPTNVKQLVVEADNREKSVLISTIVLTDGVERVGKTGVAIELSDKGTRTGIIYMIQLRNETSAGGLFDSLLEGSDRMARR